MEAQFDKRGRRSSQVKNAKRTEFRTSIAYSSIYRIRPALGQSRGNRRRPVRHLRFEPKSTRVRNDIFWNEAA